MTDAFSPRLLTVGEVSNLTGLSASWLNAARGKSPYSGPPFMRAGTAIRYPIDKLQDWIERQIVATSGGASDA